MSRTGYQLTKLSQTKFKLRSSDSNFILSYLFGTLNIEFRDRSRFFVRDGHDGGNPYFLKIYYYISCHRQTYQNYLQPLQRSQQFLMKCFENFDF